MKPILRSIGLVFLGVVISLALIWGIEQLNNWLFQFMKGVNEDDLDAQRQAVSNLPVRALLLWLLEYFIGTFCGACFAAWLTPAGFVANTWPMAHAMCVGLVLLVASLSKLFGLPYPPWFYLACFIVFPLAAYLAGRLVLFWRSRPASSP
jgi:hypothetical protein